MLNRLFKNRKESEEEAFWNWFAAHSVEYFDFERDQETLFKTLNQELAKVHDGLTFEFGPKENSARDFVISADGDRAVFPAVQNLVAAAPELGEWRIIAFRPRRSTDLELQIGDTKFGPDQLWFQLEPDDEKVGLHLFLEGIEASQGEMATTISFLMLDNALGEYDVETKVGFLHFCPLTDTTHRNELKPFHELPHEFDALYVLLNEF